MINNIRNTFIDILDQSIWMDSISKSRAIEKVDKELIIFNLEKNKLLSYRYELSMKKLVILII